MQNKTIRIITAISQLCERKKDREEVKQTKIGKKGVRGKVFNWFGSNGSCGLAKTERISVENRQTTTNKGNRTHCAVRHWTIWFDDLSKGNRCSQNPSENRLRIIKVNKTFIDRQRESKATDSYEIQHYDQREKGVRCGKWKLCSTCVGFLCFQCILLLAWRRWLQRQNSDEINGEAFQKNHIHSDRFARVPSVGIHRSLILVFIDFVFATLYTHCVQIWLPADDSHIAKWEC